MVKGHVLHDERRPFRKPLTASMLHTKRIRPFLRKHEAQRKAFFSRHGYALAHAAKPGNVHARARFPATLRLTLATATPTLYI